MSKKLHLLLNSENELIDKFVSTVRSCFFDGICSIYNTTKKRNKIPKLILREFQQELKNTPLWSQQMLKNEYERIKLSADAPNLDELIRKIFKTVVKISCINRGINKNDLVDLTLPDPIHLIHIIYINIARALWYQPELCYHRFSRIETRNNIKELNKIICEKIQVSISELDPILELDNSSINDTESSDHENMRYDDEHDSESNIDHDADQQFDNESDYLNDNKSDNENDNESDKESDQENIQSIDNNEHASKTDVEDAYSEKYSLEEDHVNLNDNDIEPQTNQENIVSDSTYDDRHTIVNRENILAIKENVDTNPLNILNDNNVNTNSKTLVKEDEDYIKVDYPEQSVESHQNNIDKVDFHHNAFTNPTVAASIPETSNHTDKGLEKSPDIYHKAESGNDDEIVNDYFFNPKESKPIGDNLKEIFIQSPSNHKNAKQDSSVERENTKEIEIKSPTRENILDFIPHYEDNEHNNSRIKKVDAISDDEKSIELDNYGIEKKEKKTYHDYNVRDDEKRSKKYLDEQKQERLKRREKKKNREHKRYENRSHSKEVRNDKKINSILGINVTSKNYLQDKDRIKRMLLQESIRPI